MHYSVARYADSCQYEEKEMSASRAVIAEVCEVPEEYVKCTTCRSYKNGYCSFWDTSVSPEQAEMFCSLWLDKMEDKE